MRVLVMIVIWLFSLGSAADEIDSAGSLFPQAAASHLVIAQARSSLLPGQGVKVSNKEATSYVKQRYSGSKILSINLIQSQGPPVYRVKTLSSDGVVKYVFVDGTTGDVFE